MEKNKMKMEWTPKVVEQITDRCTEVETGARNIDYIIKGTILPQMSLEILSHMSGEGMPSSVSLDVAKDGSFKFDFEE